MIKRKKNLLLIQLGLLIVGMLVIFFTYMNNEKEGVLNIIPPQNKEKIINQLSNNNKSSDVFYNIEYSGIDLSGNRYKLKSEEAVNNKDFKDIVDMKNVNAIFYFKDDTILKIKSSFGAYNNKTLDMKFRGDVEADYVNSKLYSEEAEYLNSKSYLTISNQVKLVDSKGTMYADKLFFDIEKKKLNISFLKNIKINSNINLNEKRFKNIKI